MSSDLGKIVVYRGVWNKGTPRAVPAIFVSNDRGFTVLPIETARKVNDRINDLIEQWEYETNGEATP